ncbi:MAG: FHA domain-containing protein [Chthoniobacterales bacterium]
MRKLMVTSGAVSVAHELVEDVITIGRSPENSIHIDDPSVSGKHARLEMVGEDYHLKDLESTNGTRVNGQPIQSILLRAGDRVRFGKVESSFQSESGTVAQPAPVVPATDARPAEVSARPADFANASPFPRRSAQSDPVRTAIFVAAAVAMLAFLGSLFALGLMQPPVF